MSATDLAGLFDFLDIARTDLLGDAKDIVGAFFKSPEKDPNDDIPDSAISTETEPAEWWQHYGFASRPPKNAQGLILRAGASFVALASRVLEAAKVFGKLKDGDVAIYSIGGNVLRLNADGSVSLLVPTENGKQIVAHCSNKESGSVKVVIPPGIAIEASDKNGVFVNAGDKDITLAGNKLQLIFSGGVVNESPSFKSWMGATKPFTGGPAMPPSPGLFV